MQEKDNKPTPIAVLISDIHFNLQTLEVASAALLRAQFKAATLKVPLIIAGDLLDSKAIIRAEVANKLIDMLSVSDGPQTIILVGNHDLINERNSWTFEHALNFLKPYAAVIERPRCLGLGDKNVLIIPYSSHDNPSVFKDMLREEKATDVDLIIMHQGLVGSDGGDYIQDKSAVSKDLLSSMRVISGHYHRRQTIQLPNNGVFDYIGNPYTLTFGEVNDPAKGYQILNDDLTLTFVPTDLRKHVILKVKVDKEVILDIEGNLAAVHKNDLVRVKLIGQSDHLTNWDKQKLQTLLHLNTNFILDTVKLDTQKPQNMIQSNVSFDDLINDLENTDTARKTRLKNMWKELLSQ